MQLPLGKNSQLTYLKYYSQSSLQKAEYQPLPQSNSQLTYLTFFLNTEQRCDGLPPIRVKIADHDTIRRVYAERSGGNRGQFEEQAHPFPPSSGGRATRSDTSKSLHASPLLFLSLETVLWRGLRWMLKVLPVCASPLQPFQHRPFFFNTGNSTVAAFPLDFEGATFQRFVFGPMFQLC